MQERVPDLDLDARRACEALLGHRFRRPELLTEALTHASAKGPDRPSNERLEFLGDAVLGLIVSEHLCARMPEAAEGELTKLKSALVSARTLARRARRLGLERFLVLGPGMKRERVPDSVLADLFEALVAALYLDGGLAAARPFVLGQLKSALASARRDRTARNYKSLLQHYTQKHLAATPSYSVVREEGPDHRKRFSVVARVGERTFAAATGSSKKEAEQRAARKALAALKREATKR